MVRNNRTVTRLSLILVLCAGLFGGWYGFHNWQPDLSSMNTTIADEETDWVELIAGIGEETVQFFLGVASGE